MYLDYFAYQRITPLYQEALDKFLKLPGEMEFFSFSKRKFKLPIPFRLVVLLSISKYVQTILPNKL